MIVALKAMALCGLMLVLSMAASPAAGCTLGFGWEPYRPYAYEENGEVMGMDVMLLRLLAGEQGCSLMVKQLPWARLLLELRAGNIDVSASTSWTPERAEFALFSIPYRRSEVAIFVRRGEGGRYALNSLADIPAIGFRLGYIRDYYYGAEFAHLMESSFFASHLEDAPSYAINIQKLLARRIDGFIVDDIGVMGSEAAALGALDQVERYPLAIASKDLYFMFSRASVDPVLVAAINRSLAAMKADGRLQAIIDRFLEMAPRSLTGPSEATDER